MKKAKTFLVVAGIIYVLVGMLVMLFPGVTLATLSVMLGVGILVAGIFNLISYFNDKEMLKSPGWTLTAGILDIVIGLILLGNIGATAMAIPLVVGFWAIFGSIARIAASITFKNLGFNKWWVAMVAGIIGLVLAYFIIVNPAFGAIFVTTYIGIYFVFVGMMALAEAMVVKK
ncbi:uncharacterized membrane protein HdeD (DUF308 family) [Elusimicrobium simillimum]|uniref:HdeD family acid-resistance protein n=1 Tax=Elusimicrobium simillimum TaxID=3143438 RepID=UPI003C705AD3